MNIHHCTTEEKDLHPVKFKQRLLKFSDYKATALTNVSQPLPKKLIKYLRHKYPYGASLVVKGVLLELHLTVDDHFIKSLVNNWIFFSLKYLILIHHVP